MNRISLLFGTSRCLRLTAGMMVSTITLFFTLPLSAQAQPDNPPGPEAQAMLQRVQPILDRVVEIRGLSPLETIRPSVFSRGELRDVLVRIIDEEMGPENWRLEERVLQRLGVLQPERPYRELMLTLLMQQIAGFYDDDTGQLFLIDDLPLGVLEPTMAHELFHGIQDQLWNIGAIGHYWDCADDAVLAAMALIEGDALGVMIDYTLGGALRFTNIPNIHRLVGEQLDSLDAVALAGIPPDVPGFLIDSLLFPYLDGLTFVHVLHSAVGWDGVNSAYTAPPLSTEQVVHPERYLDRDHPTWIQVDLSVMEQDGFVRAYDQVLGEFGFKALFRDVLAEQLSNRAIVNATEGWDGDRLIGLENPSGEFVLLALTVWDTIADASEFLAVLQCLLEANHGAGLRETQVGPNGIRVEAYDRGSRIVLEQWGDMVLFMDGIPQTLSGERAERWIDSIWLGRTRSAYPTDSACGS